MKSRVLLSPAACAVSFSLGIASPGESADVVSTWSGAVSATWADDANWDNAPGPDVFPNNDGFTTYDALINAAGGPYTVSLASDITVDGLTIDSADATLELQAGNLTANTGITLTSGLLYFNGGVVLNTTITPGGGSVLFGNNGGNRLDGSTLIGDLALNQGVTSHYVLFQNGASFSGDAQIGTPDGNVAVFGFDQSVTLDAKTLNFDPAFGGAYLSIDGDSTMTFSSDLIARGAANIGQAFFVSGTQTLLNQGLISADLAGQTTTINPAIFTNEGIAEAINGATLTLQASNWTNEATGTIRGTGPGSILNFHGSYSNSGDIELTDAVLNLYGTFTTAGLGIVGFSRSGTTEINILGDLDNTGGTFALNAATGDWNLQGGRIIGGTITESAGAKLLFAGNGGNRLDGALLDGDLVLDQAAGSHYVLFQNGASFSGDAQIGTPDGNVAVFGFDQSVTLDDRTLNFDPAFGSAYLSIDGDSTMTFGPDLIARGASNIGQAFFVSGNQTLLNQGLISADLAGQTTTINPAIFTNEGIAEAINGATLALQATDWTNEATGTIRATGPGSILNFHGSYSNSGDIELTDAVLNLYGTFTTAGLGIGGFSRSGTTEINIFGDLDNTGGTFALNAATGDWILQGGRIIGGTITESAGAKLLFAGNGGNRLDGALLDGDLVLDQAAGSHYVLFQNGASFSGDAQIGTPDGNVAVFGFDQSVTLDAKTLNFDPAFGSAYLSIDGDSTMTFGPDLIARGAANIGQAFFVSGTQTLLNQGLISADLVGQTTTINPAIFTNTGVIEARNGSALLLQPIALSNVAGGSLTGGSWKAFADSSLWFYANDFSTNAADLTLDGAASQIWQTQFQTPLEDVLTTNLSSGALRILGGRDYATTNTFANAGNIQLGGGTFGPSVLTNTGTLFGFGSVNVRPTNSGTIRSAAGTLSFADGILAGAGSGTVQVDPGSTLDLSTGPAGGSSAHFLVQDGNLTLDTNTFLVRIDYTNANSGIGNSFDPRANVSGSGGILAFGGTGQTLGGGSVTGAATATPTMAFGKVHVGDSPTLNYRINNTGTSGSRLRGAIQTTVNGGNLTDPRLSGVGVTAGNFGPILPTENTGNLPVTFTASSAGALTGQTVRLLNNFDNVADQTLSITGTAYRYAAPSNHSPAPVNFGNFHVDHAPSPSQVLTISNTAANDGFSESLNASIGGATGGVNTNAGSFTALSPGSSNSSSLSVGIGTGSAGSKNGTATITLTSNGTGSSGLGLTALASQTVTVTGAVYRYALPVLPGGTAVDFGIVHVGELAEQSVSVSNSVPNDNYSESLNGSFSGSTGDLSGAGSFTALAPGSSSTAPVVTLNTTAAGPKAGTATLALVSNGSGSSGLANTTLSSQLITATGQVNHYAAPVFTKDSGAATLGGSGTAYTVDFGRRTIGEAAPSVTLRLTNSAVAPSDTLAGSFVTAAPDFTLSGFGNFSNVAAGQSQTNLVVSLQTDTLGAFSQTITLNSLSENSGGFSGPLDPITITLTGEVAVVPQLKIQVVGTNAVLSWPLAEQSWILKKGDNLTGWSTVAEPIIDTPTEHTVTTPRGVDPKLFFRLQK